MKIHDEELENHPREGRSGFEIALIAMGQNSNKTHRLTLKWNLFLLLWSDGYDGDVYPTVTE